MAEVFLGKDGLHGLAVKVLREGNTTALRCFADEGRLLANLRDLHLVQVRAVGEDKARARPPPARVCSSRPTTPFRDARR